VLLDPLISQIFSISLGLMFVIAAIHKISNRSQFRITLLEYQILPEITVLPASWIIPTLELLLGVAWLIGIYQQGLTAITSIVLLAAYSLAIGINIGRGRVYFDCGCGFGGKIENEQYLSASLIARNFGLVGVILITMLPVGSRDFGTGDYLIFFAALLTSALLFGAINQLLGNRASINTWRKN